MSEWEFWGDMLIWIASFYLHFTTHKPECSLVYGWKEYTFVFELSCIKCLFFTLIANKLTCLFCIHYTCHSASHLWLLILMYSAEKEMLHNTHCFLQDVCLITSSVSSSSIQTQRQLIYTWIYTNTWIHNQIKTFL